MEDYWKSPIKSPVTTAISVLPSDYYESVGLSYASRTPIVLFLVSCYMFPSRA